MFHPRHVNNSLPRAPSTPPTSSPGEKSHGPTDASRGCSATADWYQQNSLPLMWPLQLTRIVSLCPRSETRRGEQERRAEKRGKGESSTHTESQCSLQTSTRTRPGTFQKTSIFYHSVQFSLGCNLISPSHNGAISRPRKEHCGAGNRQACENRTFGGK